MMCCVFVKLWVQANLVLFLHNDPNKLSVWMSYTFFLVKSKKKKKKIFKS